LGIRILWFRLLSDSLFCLQQQKSKQKNAAPLNPGFYLKSEIKVPSSLPIFVAAAELTNKKQFAQTAAAESPTKITRSSAWVMGI